MSIDVVDLRNFYGQRLGVVARRFVGRGIRSLWNDTAGQRVLGIGYATPYLGLFREEAERCLAFMPAGQGVVKWPTTRPALSALVDENELPLPDSAVDRVILVHALEMTNDPAALLREVWRVLASGGGRLVVALSRGVGAHRGDAVGAVRRRAHGGSDQAGLPRDPRAPRQTPAGAGARAGAGAFAGHLNTYARPRGSGDPVQIKDLDSRWSLPPHRRGRE